MLRLELTDPGCDASVLSEFCTRLIVGAAEFLLCDTLLTWGRDRQLLTTGGRQRSNSTHILAAVRALKRSTAMDWGLLGTLKNLAHILVYPLFAAAYMDDHHMLQDNYRLDVEGTLRQFDNAILSWLLNSEISSYRLSDGR